MSNSILDTLTPERLREDARLWRSEADALRATLGDRTKWGPTVLAYSDEVLGRGERCAALCEAVAKAQEAIRTAGEGGYDLCFGGVGDRGVSSYQISDEGDVRCEWHQHETLAAALGAVGDTEGA